MLKNNEMALIAHISIIFVGSSTAIKFLDMRDLAQVLLAVGLGILFSCLYVLLGYHMMECTKSLLKDYISVISVLAAGILLWCMCFYQTYFVHQDPHTLVRMVWSLYLIYTIPVFLLTAPLQSYMDKTFVRHTMAYDIINLYMVVLLSLLYWIGIYLRRKKNENVRRKGESFDQE